MIGAVTFFWNRTTNNFHLPCGMIGMSLLDVVSIIGLPISPVDFTSDMQPKHQYNIAHMTSYSDFIAHHMGAEGDPVTDDEHVAFLFYWLNAIIFCSRNVQMQKLFLTLVALLHEGNNLNLAKLLLGHIFEEHGQFLWLNAIFEKPMIKPIGGSSDEQHIEGFRLTNFKPNFLEAQLDKD
ncbi:hypothetical protein Ahy_A09g042453 [Arachis hypogaea]|uniref:Aminotransferase-like plant mobile domain-containing protein n=1 Tax=Arachis hypogaea TaxID=3818 RepID=A0A445BFX0_ARAHY|nr:hypothetical protein Ahy_A09g042453 [Arachis hypogaea]